MKNFINLVDFLNTSVNILDKSMQTENFGSLDPQISAVPKLLNASYLACWPKQNKQKNLKTTMSIKNRQFSMLLNFRSLKVTFLDYINTLPPYRVEIS